MSTKIITPPQIEPLTIADVEAQLQATLPDDQVMLVEGFIAAVRQKCESDLRRALITQSHRLTTDGFPYPTARNRFAAIEIPLPPLQSVESIKYLAVDGTLTTLEADGYVVDADSTPGRVMPAYGKTWPATLNFPGAVRVEFTAGYGDDVADVPQCLKNWMLLNVANLYEHRETVSIGTGGVIELHTLADSLLDPERWEVRV